MELKQTIQAHMNNLIEEWVESDFLQTDDLFVIGCSTSEVAGEKIGTSGSEQIAQHIFQGLEELQAQTGVKLVFQCCEHINRALVIERETMQLYNLEEVTVIPLPEAGGSMASYAYKHMNDAVVVETIQAHAGIDIGDTMIGMQLRPVAVPLRFKQTQIGNARLTGARTRPKLIGGARACYE